MWEDVTLEMARVEREALARVRLKLSAQQLGEAWIDLLHDQPQDRALVARQPLAGLQAGAGEPPGEGGLPSPAAVEPRCQPPEPAGEPSQP